MLRNIVDNEGIEILYDLYSPMILEIQVLKLQKRIDKDLQYLRYGQHPIESEGVRSMDENAAISNELSIFCRDALPEYSTVPWDMEPEQHPEGAPVPVDETKVIMKPLPWTQRWEKKDIKGETSISFLLANFSNEADRLISRTTATLQE